jgi:predicted Rossmann-fold nucleotide-binding protein
MKTLMVMAIKNIIIVSGGQSGVDRAALDFALENGIKCSGWCPAGRLAEDGMIAHKYPLNETASKDPAVRTRLNVEQSDATLIIYRGEMDEGTRLCKHTAKQINKPLFIVNLAATPEAKSFQQWFNTNTIRKLNIAGPRESNTPGIYKATKVLLITLFEKII